LAPQPAFDELAKTLRYPVKTGQNKLKWILFSGRKFRPWRKFTSILWLKLGSLKKTQHEQPSNRLLNKPPDNKPPDYCLGSKFPGYFNRQLGRFK
jgi:hypothetical protein